MDIIYENICTNGIVHVLKSYDGISFREPLREKASH